MSEYQYDNRISSNDIINHKSAFSCDGTNIGQVEAALADSFIVRLLEDNSIEVKYDIPRLEIERIVDDTITLKLTKEIVENKYKTSSIKKNWQ